MWISLLTLLLLLVTPISCRAEIRQEHGTRFRLPLRISGIPLRFDHPVFREMMAALDAMRADGFATEVEKRYL